MRMGQWEITSDKIGMSRIKICGVTKRDGVVKSREGLHRWLDSTLDSCRNGEYRLSFGRRQEPRILDQNRLMWLWFSCISDETGQRKEDIHDYYCDLFLKRRVTVNGKERLVAMGTSGLDRETMAMFLNKVQADASSEFGIRLPNPDDRDFDNFREYYKNYL